jgi:predicted nucleotidyltransferase
LVIAFSASTRAVAQEAQGLNLYLEDRFGKRVDLVTRAALKPPMRPVVEREALDVT